MPDMTQFARLDYMKKGCEKSMLELDNIKYEMGTVDGSLKELGESL
jgi:hypothetical protein